MLVTLRLSDLDALLRRRIGEIASPALPRFLTSAQCADWLGCTPQAISHWCRDADMPHVMLGSERRFDPDEVIEWMRSRGKRLSLPVEPTMRHLQAVRRPTGDRP